MDVVLINLFFLSRGSSGRKNKEKGDGREASEAHPNDPPSTDQRDKGGATNKTTGHHQVHPETQTIEKMNTMMSVDGLSSSSPACCVDVKSESDWSSAVAKDKDSSRDSFWSIGSNKMRENNSSPSPLPPYHHKSDEMMSSGQQQQQQQQQHLESFVGVVSKRESYEGQLLSSSPPPPPPPPLPSSRLDRDLICYQQQQQQHHHHQQQHPVSNKVWHKEAVVSLKGHNTIANMAALNAENSPRKCKKVAATTDDGGDGEKRDPVKVSNLVSSDLVDAGSIPVTSDGLGLHSSKYVLCRPEPNPLPSLPPHP